MHKFTKKIAKHKLEVIISISAGSLVRCMRDIAEIKEENGTIPTAYFDFY